MYGPQLRDQPFFVILQSWYQQDQFLNLLPAGIVLPTAITLAIF